MDKGEILLRRAKRWKAAKWACFAVVAVAVVLALTAAVDRLQQTADMIDSGAAGSRDYQRMTERSGTRTVVGLGIGCAGIIGYMACIIMHQRARSALRTFQADQRRARLAELGVEDVDL